jgi:hypothetical protein
VCCDFADHSERDTGVCRQSTILFEVTMMMIMAIPHSRLLSQAPINVQSPEY